MERFELQRREVEPAEREEQDGRPNLGNDGGRPFAQRESKLDIPAGEERCVLSSHSAWC